MHSSSKQIHDFKNGNLIIEYYSTNCSSSHTMSKRPFHVTKQSCPFQLLCMGHSVFSQHPTNGYFCGFVLPCYKHAVMNFLVHLLLLIWICIPAGLLSQQICTFEMVIYIVNLCSKNRLINQWIVFWECMFLQILIIRFNKS